MLLKNGSKGDDVKKLQQKLGVTADGDFGPGTEAAVKKWQAANGLTADGIVGQATWDKMFPAAPAGKLDLNKLKGHVPDAVIAQIPGVMEKFQINTPLRLCHFLAQCAHESGNFKATRELLNYSARALTATWPKRFPADIAPKYERKPEMIANRAYADRMDNGPEASGDGWKYRGRGYIQLTGKVNYKAFDKFVDENIVDDPDLVATKYPLLSAAWYWNSRALNVDADKGASDEVVIAVTKKVNGGTIGLPDRLKHFKEFYGLFK